MQYCGNVTVHERRKDCKRLNLIYWAGCHNLYAMESHQKCVLMLNRYESPDGCPPAADPLLIVTRQHVQSLRTAAVSSRTTVTANLNQFRTQNLLFAAHFHKTL